MKGTIMTQKERVLKSLRASGEHGITQADWSGAFGPTPDGGPPITRLAARVLDLKQDGYQINRKASDDLRNLCRVYYLRTQQPIVVETSAAELIANDKHVMSPYEFEAAA
jgi:hypothetical protein